jgi:hypothetical protein
LDARKNQGFSVNLKIGHVVFPFNNEVILMENAALCTR